MHPRAAQTDPPFVVTDPGPPPEVLPMPGSAFLAVAFAWASIPLGLSGPAGVLAGGLAFYFRARFLSAEREVPGHRGSRLVAAVAWMAGLGVGIGVAATGLLVVFALTTTVPAK